MKKFLTGLGIVVVLLLCLVAFAILSNDPRQTLGPQPGDAAPDITLRDLEGKEFKLSAFRSAAGTPGRPVLLAFWSPTCPTGNQHMESFAATAQWCEKNGVEFFAVDAYGDTAAHAAELVKQHQVGYRVCMDEDTRIAQSFGAKVVTATYLIDPDGRVRYRGAIADRQSGDQRTLHAVRAAQSLIEGKEIAEPKIAPFG